jgi:N-acetyl sugar amidotransferase
MDTTDPEITFDEQGVCNHCKRYDALSQTRLIAPEKRDEELATLIREIKQVGAGKPYDCVIGVSGGVDSTYVAWLVKEQGLRPLAVHLDNGWNSELATANIEKTLKTLDIDLYTHVIDWDSFNNLQLSFLYASTPDGEVPTDHAIFALLYRLAAKYNLRHVITGTNVASEAILPEKWGYGYFDLRYIRDVHKRFGTQKLVNYPCFTLKQLGYYVFGKKIRLVSILNYIEYRKSDAMDVLENRLGWIYYGGKHYESIYTRFYQAYILPRKFDIDKRKAHYSNLVLSGQMARQEALDAMQEPVYPESLLQEDREYVIKKFGLSNTAFNNIMNAACKTFENYANNRGLFNKAKSMVNAGRRYIG